MDNEKSKILMEKVQKNRPFEEIKEFILANAEDINFGYVDDPSQGHNYLVFAKTPEVVQLLIDAGVNVNAVDDVGDSVANHHTHRPEIYNLLRGHGAINSTAYGVCEPVLDLYYVLNSENTWEENLEDIKAGRKSVDAIKIDKFPIPSALSYAYGYAQEYYKRTYGLDDDKAWARADLDVEFLLKSGANPYVSNVDLTEAYEDDSKMLNLIEKSRKKWIKEHIAKIRKRDKEEKEKKIGNIEKNKRNILKSRKLRRIVEARDGKLSGTVIADKIAEDVISGKEKRTITPEIGAEIRRRITADKLQEK